MRSLRPIKSEKGYENATAEVERLWGAPAGTREGDMLDVLATLIDVYESERYPMDPPDPIEAIKFRMEQQGLPRRFRKNSAPIRRVRPSATGKVPEAGQGF